MILTKISGGMRCEGATILFKVSVVVVGSYTSIARPVACETLIYHGQSVGSVE